MGAVFHNDTDGNFGVIKGGVGNEYTVCRTVGNRGGTCFTTDADGVVGKNIGGGTFCRGQKHSLGHGTNVFLFHSQFTDGTWLNGEYISATDRIGHAFDEMGFIACTAVDDGGKVGGKLNGGKEIVRLTDGGLQGVTRIPLTVSGVGPCQRAG